MPVAHTRAIALALLLLAGTILSACGQTHLTLKSGERVSGS